MGARITPFAFRVVGDCAQSRRLVDADTAFAAYASCDDRAELDKESYLSLFRFGDDFKAFLAMNQTTRGFAGVCGADWFWFDIDADGDLPGALNNARRLAVHLTDVLGISDDDVLVFFSGAKGFHVGIPTALWQPEPSIQFHRNERRFAEVIAATAGVAIDVGIYDRVRAFRAPNSRHAKTGLHKRRLSVDELLHLSVDRILDLAKAPAPFDIPAPSYRSEPAATAWRSAVGFAEHEADARRKRSATNGSGAHLNRATMQFIREGAASGDRHRLLFSAAANLAEYGCSAALAHALLSESALDCGLSPADVRRQIDCGLAAAVAPHD